MEQQLIASGPGCPNCMRRPLTMDKFTGRFPDGTIMSLVHCHDCGYVLPAIFAGVEQPQIATAPAGLRLV